MENTTLCGKLLRKIAEKFILQAEWQDRAPLPQPPEATGEADSSARLESELDDLADRLLYAPLCLLPLPARDRPVGVYLRIAADILNDLAAPSDEPPFLPGAQTAIARALAALKLDADSEAMDKGLVLLFAAGLLAKREAYEYARETVKLALPYFPRQGVPHCMVANLLSGNFYYFSGQASQAAFEGVAAYSQALRQLARLSQTEAQYGRKHQAELYRLLKEKLARRLADRDWKNPF